MATPKKVAVKKAVKKVAAKKPTKKPAAKKSVVVRPAAPKKQKIVDAIALTISVNDQIFEVETNNIAEALSKLDVNPKMLKTKFIIVAEYHGKKFECVLNVHMARRVLTNEMARNLLEKGAKMALAYNAH